MKRPDLNLGDADAEFVERILRYLDDEISGVELGALNQELRNDPEKRQVFIAICRDARFVHESQACPGDEKIEKIRFKGLVSGLAGLGRPREKVWTKPVLALAIAASLAFLVALTAILTGWFQRRNPVQAVAVARPAVATVVDMLDVKWHEHQPHLQPGARITTGVLRLTKGVVQLETERGVRMTLEGPAEFELKSGVLTRLHEGRMCVEVSKLGRGFIIETEGMNLADLGTAFGIEVADGETRVAVFDGEVEVDKPSESGSTSARRLVKAGRAVESTLKSAEIGSLSLDEAVRGLGRLWRMNSGVAQMYGNVVFQTPGAPSDPYRYEDPENVLILPERMDVRVRESLRVDIVEPGAYDRFAELRSGELAVKPGEEMALDSFLIQVYGYPAGKRSKRPRRGTIRFGREVAGVIVNASSLQHTDSLFAVPSDGDPATVKGGGRLVRQVAEDYLIKRVGATLSELRGLEERDRIELAGDRRTISFHFAAGGGRDQIRVLLKR